MTELQFPMTVEEAAERSGANRWTIYQWTKRHPIGRKNRWGRLEISREDYEWIKRRIADGTD